MPRPVIKACFYDPQINRSYIELAAHYGMAILPARPRRPLWRVGASDASGRTFLLVETEQRLLVKLEALQPQQDTGHSKKAVSRK